MWLLFGLVLGLGAFLLLSANPKIENAKAALFGEFNFPRADFGSALPILWGRFRQDSPILLWYGGFRSQAITQKVKTGLFSSKQQTIGYKYYFTMDLALCLGPEVRLKRIWANSNKLVWEGNLTTDSEITINLPELFGGEKQQGGLAGKIRFYTGVDTSAQDSALLSLIGPNVPAYNGICRVVFEDFYIGTAAQPPTFSFEVERIPASISGTALSGAMPNAIDMNPISAALDLFTMRWGGFGSDIGAFDVTAFIRDAATVRTEAASGMTQGFSQILQSSTNADDVLVEIMEHVDGILFEDPATGNIATKLLRQDYNADTIPHFTDASIVGASDLRKTAWDATINRSRLTFKDRATSYDTSVAMADDFALISYQGRVRSADRTMNSVTSPIGAAYIAARNLSYSNIPLMSFTLEVNRKGASIRPGDVIKVTHTKGFNLNGLIMRVVKVGLGSLSNGIVELKCIQDRFSSHIGSFAAPGQSQFVAPDTTARPVTAFNIFTAPFFLASNGSDTTAFESAARLLIAAKRPGTGSQSFDAPYSSTTTVNEDSELIGDDLPYSVIGQLSAQYLAATAAATRYDISATLKVTGLSTADLNSISNFSSLSQARSGGALMTIGNELFVYLQPILNYAEGSVTFTQLYRGVLDTAPATHAAGASVTFLNGSSSVTEGIPVGAVAYLKLLDGTPTNNYLVSLATMTNVTPSDRASRPLQPGNVTLNGSRAPSAVVSPANMTVAWARRSRLDTQLRMYAEADVGVEPGCNVRVRWRLGGGAYTTVLSTGTSISIATAGMVGTLEVIVDGWNPNTSKASTVSETLTIQLLAP